MSFHGLVAMKYKTPSLASLDPSYSITGGKTASPLIAFYKEREQSSEQLVNFQGGY